MAPNYRNGVITYEIRDYSGVFTQQTERDIYESAFRIWSNIVNVTFRRVNRRADFIIEWRNSPHFDSTSVLAHANSGHITFNLDFAWTDDATGSDLFSVAAHEVGHVLGMEHTGGFYDIMYPLIPSKHLKRFARQTDIDVIQLGYTDRGNKGVFPRSMVVADVDSDGQEEIVHIRNSDGNLYSFRFDCGTALVEESSNWRPGQNSAWRAITVGNLDVRRGPHIVAARDFDGDIYSWYRSGRQLVPGPRNVNFGSSSNWIAMESGDFDGDGLDEIIAVRDHDSDLFLLKPVGNQLRTLARYRGFGRNSEIADLAVGDFDNDGMDEVALARNYDGDLFVLKYDTAAGSLQQIARNRSPGSNSKWVALGAGDFIGNGTVQLVAVRNFDAGYFIYRYRNGALNLVTSYTGAGNNSNWIDMSVGDYDSDGTDEIAGLRTFDNGIYVYKIRGGNLRPLASNVLDVPEDSHSAISAVNSQTAGRDFIVAAGNSEGNLNLYALDQNAVPVTLNWTGIG